MRLTITGCDGYHCYPFEGPVPVRILEEWPTYLVLEVLPHTSGVGVSMPYRITIDKWEIGRTAKITS